MTKAEQRAALAALLAGYDAPVTKAEAAPMDAGLSASFRQLGIDKKRQAVKAKKKPAPKAKRVKRNWEAQRRYDEQHGTVNGYDPYIEDALAMRRRETGDY